ncbi:hypothetical protein JHL18_00645 [Clostridium sp. YIM B02505]|uniref:Uncharacterized protein n=1 Tax=Clostridium yunnanense TaxID=2800325 RepID=A0ABS1EIH2_9CLOT|nr:hypothetical protein [Clostridium yunnanense]MBK1809156.1 hypothetical protein [Clostridium yunnanense]
MEKISDQELKGIISKDGVEFKLKNIEYSKDNFKVFFELNNSTSDAISNLSFKFKLKDNKYEDEVNSLGYGQWVDHKGWLYSGEEMKGFYQWNFNREIIIDSLEVKVSIKGKEEKILGYI